MRKLKRLYTTVAVVLVLTLSIQVSPVSVKAAYDSNAKSVGFNVDLGAYKKVKWYDRVTVNVWNGSKLIGQSCVDIGATRSKSKIGGYYLDTILTRTSMKGKGSSRKYGYADYLELSAVLKSGQKLWAHDPQTLASSTRYTVGMNLGGEVNSGGGKLSGGISASQTFLKNTLKIRDKSDPGSRLFKVNFNYDSYTWRWNWDVYGVYMYDYTQQKAAYEYKTKTSKYSCKLVHKVSYDLYDSEPGFWASSLFGYSTKTTNISFKSLY